MSVQIPTARITDIVTNVLVDTLSLPAEDIVPGADLKQDLGLDSLDLLELLSAIETQVGRGIDDTEAASIRTVGDAVAIIERLQAEGTDR
jgi:acyl carrier protein